MKKKVLSVLLVGAMTASMFAGCGNDGGKAAGADGANVVGDAAPVTEAGGCWADAEAAGNPVTLKTVSMFGGTDPNAEVYAAINDEFMAENSHVTSRIIRRRRTRSGRQQLPVGQRAVSQCRFLRRK